MSVSVGTDIILPSKRLKQALEATWKLARLPGQKLPKKHELTLPSGETILIPFGSQSVLRSMVGGGGVVAVRSEGREVA